MNSTVRSCANCGALHTKVFSWFDGLHKAFYFCNMQCKQEFMTVAYPKMLETEAEIERESKSVLPEMRELVAHKTRDGRISIVRSDSEVQGWGDKGKG